MNIATYINSFDRKERGKIRREISQKLGISEAAIKHWCTGARQIKPTHVLAIEKITDGKVNRHELRPDIYPPPKE